MLDWAEASMTREELHTFLMDEPKFAAVASLRRDGRPFVTPLGFHFDGSYMYFSIPPTRGGAKRLRHDPRVSVTVFSYTRPTRFFITEGEVEEITDPDHEISIKILNRYSDQQTESETYRPTYFSTGKVVFRLPVTEYASSDLTKVDMSNPRYAMTPAEWQEQGATPATTEGTAP